MFASLLRPRPARCVPVLLILLLMACSSRPSRLYLLNSTVAPAQTVASARSRNNDAGYGSSQPPGAARAGDARLLGVAVTVPEYLDRLDIMVRTSANEIKPNYDEQWGEGLAVTATQTLAEDLSKLLPSDDTVILPSRSRRTIDYQVNLDLTRFETAADGESVIAGRWSITDGTGNERASGRVLRSEPAAPGDFEGMAEAMSKNLAAVGAEIAQAVRQLPPSRKL